MRDANTNNLSSWDFIVRHAKKYGKEKFFFPKIALKPKITQGGPISKIIQKRHSITHSMGGNALVAVSFFSTEVEERRTP
jgi:hypothetical protein